MSSTWLISDWHLFHSNILTYCPDRRELFEDVDAMNAGLVRSAVETVGRGDTLYFLGDLSFQIRTRRSDVAALLIPLRDRLGQMHWITGNHDEPDRMPEVRDLFDSVLDAKHLRAPDGRHLFLSHYPIEIAHRDQLRLVSIHGHHHGTMDNVPGRIDVSVDSLLGIRAWFNPAYRGEPITLETALTLADQEIPAPHASQGQPGY